MHSLTAHQSEQRPASMRRASAGASATAVRSGPLTPSAVLGLQRSAGNSAVSGLLQRCGAGGCSCGGTCGKGGAGSIMSRAHGLDELAELDDEHRI